MSVDGSRRAQPPVNFREEDVIIRLAKPTDEESVKALSRLTHRELYKTDYLSAWFRKLVTGDDRVVMVAEWKGQVIGFTMVGVFDDGETLQGEGGRMHPDFQGKLVFSRLRIAIAQTSHKKYPQWKRARDCNRSLKYYDADNIMVLTERVVFRIHLTSNENIPLAERHCSTGILTDVSAERLSDILSHPDQSKHLFPEGLICTEHNVFNAQPCNVPVICRYHDQILLCGDVTSSNMGISIGGRLDCDDGRAWRYNFNYSGVIDLDVCLEHLAEHLRRCANEPPQRHDTYLIVMIPKHFVAKHGVDSLTSTFCEILSCPKIKMSHMPQYVIEYIDSLKEMKPLGRSKKSKL